MTPQHIAVIDVGKTNAKLALVDAATWTELAVLTRPNTVLQAPPYPHFDLDGHWDFFVAGLRRFHRDRRIDAISITTHGASGVLLTADGALAAPMLDYEHPLPDTGYDAIHPDFAETGSPRLPQGLNLGAQLHWLLADRDIAARTAHVLTYPQYWAWRLTGTMATDVTSLGCHTDLWNPWQARFSGLADRLGIDQRIATPRRSSEVLGVVRSGLGLPAVPVACGIHDSNASLLPHLLAREGAFAVVSTGTWVVAMAVKGDPVTLDPAQDVLVNVNALGDPVPSGRFMGGRDYEIVRGGGPPATSDADREAVFRDGAQLLSPDEWRNEPATHGARMVALGHYLARRTHDRLEMIGARGPLVIEGPFARNPDYLMMLAALRSRVETAASATGTSIGAAMLLTPPEVAPETCSVVPDHADALRALAASNGRRKI